MARALVAANGVERHRAGFASPDGPVMT